jgi:hypothetical protein
LASLKAGFAVLWAGHKKSNPPGAALDALKPNDPYDIPV